LLATFTITAEELADAAESDLLWTDQDVQRGILPEAQPLPPRELSLKAGYPDTTKYSFDSANADSIVEKILYGDKLFLSPLVWNLRPGTFSAAWNETEKSLYLYQGRFFIPDSHHRQQAILKAVRLWRSDPKDYPKFQGTKEFKLELYFLSREDEGNYFFDKNQRPKPTAKSKAYDLTTVDDLSVLAKQVIERSSHLRGNVNRVTDRLTNKNSQVVTLSTLREMMKAFAPSDQLDTSELAGLAAVAAQFYDLLANVRIELGNRPTAERRKIRSEKIVDAAVMMHGYAALMRDYNDSLAESGTSRARADWSRKLARFGPDKVYRFRGERWRGDLFEKRNPLWNRIGVIKPGKRGNLTVLNTGAARSELGRVLRMLIHSEPPITDLQPLARQGEK